MVKSWSFLQSPWILFCPKSFCTTEHNDNQTVSHSKTTVNKQISMKPKTQPTLLAFQKKSESTSQTLPSRPSQRRTSEQAEFYDKLNGQGIKKPASPPWAPTKKRKFIPTWKEEFPWLVYSEQDNSMTCSICLEAPAEVAGKSLFLLDELLLKRKPFKFMKRAMVIYRPCKPSVNLCSCHQS